VSEWSLIWKVNRLLKILKSITLYIIWQSLGVRANVASKCEIRHDKRVKYYKENEAGKERER
jgi:hypothetical protein